MYQLQPTPTQTHDLGSCACGCARRRRTYGNLLLSRCCLCALADIFQIYTYLRQAPCSFVVSRRHIVCLHCCEIRRRCHFPNLFSFCCYVFLSSLRVFSSLKMCAGAGICWWPDGRPKKSIRKMPLKMGTVTPPFCHRNGERASY